MQNKNFSYFDIFQGREWERSFSFVWRWADFFAFFALIVLFLLVPVMVGRAIWTKHVRNGKELPEIGRDNNYDFNFQVWLCSFKINMQSRLSYAMKHVIFS